MLISLVNLDDIQSCPESEAMSLEHSLLQELLEALPGAAGDGGGGAEWRLQTEGGLPSVYPTTEFAAAAVSIAGLAAARLVGSDRVTVDRRLASAWFSGSIRPIGWEAPAAWDAIAGDYASRDGWVRLHTNAPRHRAAALAVLGTEGHRDDVAAAVSTWDGANLERAIIEAGGCAAVMRSPEEWSRSEQGVAVAAEPLIAWQDHEIGPEGHAFTSGRRPLAGVRVLDLTRILAGPVATRFLALLGADVLRIDPPGWDESLIPEVALGKRTTRLDLTRGDDRDIFTRLLASSDVVVHGYRPGALERLGFGEEERRRLRPGLVDISLNAYGWSGPRRGDRGFDSLVQMSTGIACAGMLDTGAQRPVPLPVQALDHATGYLAAAAALTALKRRHDHGVGVSARLSLARTATLLLAHRGGGDHDPFTPLGDDDYAAGVESTSWGPAARLRQPLDIDGIDLHASPARALGHDQPLWGEALTTSDR